MVGRNHTPVDQQKQYSITVGSEMGFKFETKFETDFVLAKAEYTLGIERKSSQSQSITDIMTIPPGKAIAVYQEVKEYGFWAGVKDHVLGTLTENVKETTFLVGSNTQEFPEEKFI